MVLRGVSNQKFNFFLDFSFFWVYNLFEVIKLNTASWYDSLSFSVDWVNVTVDCPDIKSFVDQLTQECDLDYFGWEYINGKGFHWYDNRVIYAPAGRAAITLSYSLLDDGTIPVDCSVINQHGILVSISGDGCRYLESLGTGFSCLQSFLKVCQRYSHNCTRFDVAMDVFDKDNPIVPLYTDFALNAFNFKADGHTMTRGNMKRHASYVVYHVVRDPDDLSKEWYNVTIGDRNATKGQCVVYNKKIEVKTGRLKHCAAEIFDSVGCTDYWYRIEYRAKNFVLANGAFENACSDDSSSLDLFYFIADGMFEFVDLTDDLQHISRCDVNVVWLDFLTWCKHNLQNGHFVQLVSQPYVRTDISRLLNYMKRVAVMVSRIEDISFLYPEEFEAILAFGRSKRRSELRYRPFEDELSSYLKIAL